MVAVSEAEYQQRIVGLERQCATLAAEVDRLRPLAEQATSADLHLADVLLLCAQCREPIKARVNTSNWIRAEFIDREGRCLRCHQEAKKVVSNERA